MIELTEQLVTASTDALELVGLPLLFAIFVLKGAFIGKLFPTSVFLPGYVVATQATVGQAVIITTVVTIGYVIGQFVIFGGTRRYGRSFVTRLPYAKLDPDSQRFERLDDWFHRYGGVGIFLTNFVPWIRGLLTIPAAVSSYPMSRYTIHTAVSTVIFHALYVVLALGGLRLVT